MQEGEHAPHLTEQITDLEKIKRLRHKTQQADSSRCPPVCLTIRTVQKMYRWERSVGEAVFLCSGSCHAQGHQRQEGGDDAAGHAEHQHGVGTAQV